MKLSAVLITALALAVPAGVSAQDREKSDRDIPADKRPPAGMCRIWLDDVPADQQPAPTDCATAVRNRPAKGRVIFGDDYVKQKKGDSSSKKPVIKGFTPTRRPPIPPLPLPIP